MVSSSLDAVERALRRLGGLAALLSLVTALSGIVRGRRRSVASPTVRLPLALRPGLLVGETVGFVAGGALLWRGFPIGLGAPTRILAAGVGAAGLLAGLGIYLASMAALGPAYDVSSASGAPLHRDQRLVTTGPYALVRHPMYTGLAIAAVGGLLLYRTWTTVVFVGLLPVLAVRARREEAALAERFGAAWAAYRDRVPAWLPRALVSPSAAARRK